MSSPQIGIVGAGNIGRVHADTLRSIGESIAAVADIDPDARREFADAYDVAETYEEYRTMIEDATLDLVVVAVPNALHADCAVAALEGDVDVFVEKPLAHTLDAAQRVVTAERDSDGRVFVGFVRAFEPWVDEVRSKVASGELGTVYDVDAEVVRRRGIPQLGSWFTRKRVSGGGALIDVGVHVLHLVLHALDFPEVASVSASTGGHFGTDEEYTYLTMWGGGPVGEGAFDVDDYARAFVRTVDGTTIHVHLAWAANGESNDEIRIYGTDAGVTIDAADGTPRATMYSASGRALTDTELLLPEADRFADQWSYVMDVVRGERELTRNTLAEGLAVQELIAAIYESAETEREVRLNDRA